MKAAFITGVTGQDGSYLAELLHDKGYDVFGMVRYAKGDTKYSAIEGDLTDGSRLRSIINSFEPYDLIEVYNMGGVSHVTRAFEQPEHTMNVAFGTLHILEAIRQTNFSSKFRVFQPASMDSENPRSVSQKLAKYYRQVYGIFTCIGYMANHESERRRPEFVTRKITLGLSEWIKTKTPIELGNINMKRDWGYAPEYVEHMWNCLQSPIPKDVYMSTGNVHTVRDFVNAACEHLDIKIEWSGIGDDEVCFELATGINIVKINPELYRPNDNDISYVYSSEFQPKVSFEELVKKMVDNDCK